MRSPFFEWKKFFKNPFTVFRFRYIIEEKNNTVLVTLGVRGRHERY